MPAASCRLEKRLNVLHCMRILGQVSCTQSCIAFSGRQQAVFKCSLRASSGIWNAHTSVGNILGSLLAAAYLGWGWGWAFLAPGAALAGAAVLIWLFLVVEPEEAGLFKTRDSIMVSRGLLPLVDCNLQFCVSTVSTQYMMRCSWSNKLL